MICNCSATDIVSEKCQHGTRPRPYSESPTPVWDWFGLTYSSYLVMPRVLLCGMPVEWQRKFVQLLEEAQETYDDSKINDNYTVLLRGEKGRIVKDPFSNYRHFPKSELPYRESPPGNEEAEKQEPVAFYVVNDDGDREYNGAPEMSCGRIGVPLYTLPAPIPEGYVLVPKELHESQKGVIDVLFKYIDRMNDPFPPSDSAERILKEFCAASHLPLERYMDADRALTAAEEGK